jgi:hypothetical protein
MPGSSSDNLNSEPMDRLPEREEQIKVNEDRNFDQLLQSSVVVTWADLMRGSQGGLIHVEYDFTASGTLEHLQIWSSIVKGRWLLACGYQRVASEGLNTGVHFHNGYQSEGLARLLELVVSRQKAFILPRNLGRAGLLQIATPTEKESAAAAVSVNEAFDYIHSAPVELALA